jgi:exonuclease SbcD
LDLRLAFFGGYICAKIKPPKPKSMKLIHTSDWHLGQKFLSHEREEEHRKALDWLLERVKSERADMLIVAGDIFDIANPPNSARRMYYDFLRRMLESPCRHLVITGGNHDSPSMLDAPRDLLKLLNVHVVGAVTGNVADEIIELYDAEGRLEAVVAAVPFLRDGDIRNSVGGEGATDRILQIRLAILDHFKSVAEACEPYRNEAVPIIATGHLYATGAQASDTQNNIYIGMTDNIDATQFPGIFNYVALGHIHRAQAVGDIPHVRYSGSIIPLSFSETKDQKAVLSVEFQKNELVSVKPIEIPVFRRLKTIKGNSQEIEQKLSDFYQNHEHDALSAWVEMVVSAERYSPDLEIKIRDFVRDKNLEVLKIVLEKDVSVKQVEDIHANLHDLSPLEVFLLKCQQANLDEVATKQVTLTFKELENLFNQRKETTL